MKYRVLGTLTISVSTLVEADNEEDAKRLADERMPQSLCHQCSGGEDEQEWVTSGELDGVPEITDIEEEQPDV